MKYLGYYDTIKNGRLMSPASVNKMDYIARLLADSGIKVEIISCGMTSDTYLPKEKRIIDSDVSAVFFKTIRRNNKSIFNRIWCKVYENIALMFFLLKETKRNEYIIAYHSLLNMNAIRLAKRIKKFKVILEVEEIYNDVTLFSKLSQVQEIKYIREADAYIFSNYLLDKKYNESKNSIVIHGSYNLNGIQEAKITETNEVEVVYAGTFDPNKGGVYAAIESACFLPENYHISILGFGGVTDTNNVLNLIEKTNKKSKAKVEYRGLLLGEEFIQFLSKCDIGLSTQNPNAKYNDSSFPSKILTYVNCGLRVVSTNIEAIKTSDVANMVVFYDKQTPDSIASAILSIKEFDKEKYRKEMMKLDGETHKKFKSFISKLVNWR